MRSTAQKRVRKMKYCVLYMCPETAFRLAPNLRQLHARRGVALFAVDEAHCMVQWGFDFRKEYKDLSKLRRLFKGVPLMALTATATPDLQQETIRLLKMTHPLVIRQSFNRPNLRLEIRSKESKAKDQLSQLHALLAPASGASGGPCWR